GVRHLAISPSVQATERAYFGNPTELCLNWYDSEYFRPPTAAERSNARELFALARDDIAVITVGNCSSVKNHGAVVNALSQWCDHLPGIIYLHAGQEDDQRSEYRQASQLAIEQSVRFLGVLPDVRPLLYAADLIVMPSLFEGLPISLLEAMACGVPVLLADSPGLREFRTWFADVPLCPPTDEGVTAGLKAFVGLSVAGRRAHVDDWAETVKGKFGVAEGVKRYLAVYTSVARPQTK
ncbi:MAG: glycosyltransferase, partial [Burkholderiales bacterium]